MQSELIFLDSEGNVVETPKNAVKFIKNEYEDGKVISSTIGTITQNLEKKKIKENAHGVITRGVPLEEDMQEDGNDILGSVVYDVINVLKGSKYFELKNEKV